MAEKLNLNSGCRGNAGQDGRIQILFSRQVYPSPQGKADFYKMQGGTVTVGRYLIALCIFARLFWCRVSET